MSELTFDAERVRDWARLTRDDNPLHLDPEFAATTSFGVPITHGHLLAAVAVDAAQQHHGVRLLEGGRVAVRFRAPVPVDAELRLAKEAGDASRQCSALDAFIDLARSERRAGQLTDADVTRLRTDARRIQHVLPCGA